MSAKPGTKVPATQQNGKRRPLGRVVPAIPLALSKPKQARPPPPKDTDDAGAGATQITGHSLTDGFADEAAKSQVAEQWAPVANGEQHHQEANAVQSVDIVEDGDAGHLSETPASRGSAAMSLSAGATPELPTDNPATPSTPPFGKAAVPTMTTTTGSPSSTRKPTDKLDMRPLRTELPPAFVPSLEHHTPQSAASSAHRNPPIQLDDHSAHRNSNGIVFGGHDSSTSSPAPPQSATSAHQPPNYPTFGAAQPTQMPVGHTHHASEPYMQRPSHMGYRPPATPWNMRQGYAPYQPQPYFQPHAHQQFRYPPREVFTPAEPDFQPGGQYSRSRSASHGSSVAPRVGEDLMSPIATDSGRETAKTMFPEPKVAFTPGPLQLRHHHPNHMVPRAYEHLPMPHPDMTSGLDNAEALRDHVLAAFAQPSLADCHLQIHEDYDGSRRYLDCHKLILSRSPTLLQIIQNSNPPTSATLKTQVPIPLKGQYVRIRPFVDIVRYLYGGPLLVLEQPRHPIGGPESMPNNQQRMDNALEHLATGAWLKLPVVAHRGLDVATSLLHWDTVPSLLAMALDGGLGPNWSVEDGSEDRISCSSSDDSLSRADAAGTPTYEPYSTTLLQRMIDFAVHFLPHDFYLDASAPQLASCPRLPSLPLGHDSKPSRSDPRLGNIRFGEMSTDDHQRPSVVTTAISSVLLSLPFALLKCILQHDHLANNLGPDTVASIMRQVVAEREVRRKKALKARPAGRAEDGADAQLVQNLYWEEEVEVSRQYRAGFRLARRRRGIDTPPSSGAASDLSK